MHVSPPGLARGQSRGHEKDFLQGKTFVRMIKFLLSNTLTTREGGTVSIVGFDYVTNVDIDTGGLIAFHGEVASALDRDADVSLEKVALDDGGFAVRAKRRPIADRL